MTAKLTAAQTEAFYDAYKAYREGKKWDSPSIRRPTLTALKNMALIKECEVYIFRDFEFAPDKGLPLTDELGFPARYDAEKQAADTAKVAYSAQQAEYRKLLEIPDTVTVQRIVDNERWGIHYWSVLFATGIQLWGRVTLHDAIIYEISLDDIRLASTADVTTFLKEMYVANTLLTKLQTGLILQGFPPVIAKAEPPKPSALAILPGKGIGERS